MLTGIYEEANASSLIMSFAAVPADCKVNPKDEIFNPITSVMNEEMTVEEWAQNVEDAFAQVQMLIWKLPTKLHIPAG